MPTARVQIHHEQHGPSLQVEADAPVPDFVRQHGRPAPAERGAHAIR